MAYFAYKRSIISVIFRYKRRLLASDGDERFLLTAITWVLAEPLGLLPRSLRNVSFGPLVAADAGVPLEGVWHGWPQDRNPGHFKPHLLNRSSDFFANLDFASIYATHAMAAAACSWRNSSGRGSPSKRASAGWNNACLSRARCSSTASFSGVPGAAVVGTGGRGAWPQKLPTPRRANLLVGGYWSLTPGV